ncbi:FtsX-like permease family protein [Arthrobacter sp. 35W]|uniref:FtsX-like permease family protein n=1 Tax=Arthrobacter sp. 35W TaxID=1132441 RepID=UPI000428149C|nr:FtsX-like permease family protein [Arthrobacter sp. 35W]
MTRIPVPLRLLRLLWRPGAGSTALVALPVAAFALVTALVLVVLAGAMTFYTAPPAEDGSTGLYQVLASLALALMLVPLATLGSSAARLSARRRDERLSTLRLLGATPGQVGALAVLESTLLAAAGAVAGVVLYAAAVPAVALLHFRGAVLGLDALWLSPLAVFATVAGVALLAAASAAAGLRRVVLTPLGVRTRQQPAGAHWLRLALGTAAVLGIVLALSLLGSLGSFLAIAAVAAGAFAAGLAVLNLLGPFALKAVAGRNLRRAATPERLLAARTVLESPKEAWRQVSGLAMASFVAVVAGTGLALMDSAASSGTDDVLVADIRTGVVITVVASFLMVACSAGVNQAAAVLDRAGLYTSLDRLGMPVAAMDAARRRAVMSPVRTVSIGSAVVGAVVVFPLTGIALVVSPLSLATIAAVLAGGIGLVWTGLRATTPVLVRVLAAGHRS